jgi:cytoskeletal protein CcmA (bactofilin family)
LAFYSKKEKGITLMDSKHSDTVIGKETDIEGNISSSGIVRIEGNFKGEIFTSNDVIIEETGVVTGNIKAAKVSIAGTIEGNVVSFELLQIEPTGKLIGDIEVKSISISEGAVFKGRSIMMNEVYKEAEIEMSESGNYYLEE